jgi:hypothetical protein
MSRKSGYSLLEVLAAFAILTMVLAVLLPGKTALLTRLPEKEERFLALDYAHSLLARLEVEGLMSGVPTGEVRDSYRDWQVVTQAEYLSAVPESLPAEVLTGGRYVRLTVIIRSDPAGTTLATAERRIILNEPVGTP